MLAWPSASPLVPRNGGHPGGDSAYAWWFLGLLVAAFAVYVLGVLLARRSVPRVAAVAALACAVQLVPLGVPLLLSTDVWAYWDYGRIAAVHDANPYEVPPSAFPGDPAFPWIGTRWRDTTTVYGPAFTLPSEPLALAAGSSADAAAWIYKTLAALALAFVGWNPLLAVHFAGGGHNDAWLAFLVLAALAAAAAGRQRLAGVCWAVGTFIKWVPLVLLPLRAIEARATGRRVDHVGFGVAAVAVAALASVRYGTGWPEAFGSLARNANHETSWALPHRLHEAGGPHWLSFALFALAFAVAYAWLVREAWRGRARLGLATCALLLAAPYLVVWYVVWAVPLAAAEDDEPAALLSLALCAYLLRQTIPL